jgi:hypothetical protein
MGKGGGKCASRERSGSSVASRTPRLPAKPHHVTPHQSSAKAKDVDRAADTDSATLEPFIPKKMGSSQVEEDDDIDTNVMFDQQEIHSHVSDSGRRLLGSPTSIVQSAYNTAMPSPSRSFSSGGGRSPDAFHDAPDELQHFQASPSHPKHLKSGVGVSQQGGVIANTSQSSFDSTRPRFQDDDDLFPSKETIIPTSSNNSAVVHLGLRKRATSFHAIPSDSKSVSSTCNTEAPTIGGSGEETSSPINIISQTSFGLPQPQLGVTPQPKEPCEQATNIEVATPPKQKLDMKEGVHTQESTMPKESGKLSDNWELVPRELGSGSSSPVLVRMSKSTQASEVDPTSQLEAMKTENLKNLKFKEKEIEDDFQQPTNEQEENMKSMASKPFPSEHVVEGLPKEKSDPRQLQNDQPFEEEADTVRSLGSDQSDDIETHSINGDGGGYVFLGSSQHEESHDIEKLKDDKDFNKGVPIETLEEIEQHGHVQELTHVPSEKEEEPKEAKPTFEEVSHSLGFPTSPPIEEIQKDAILEASVEIPPPTQGTEPKIEVPIEEPKTLDDVILTKESQILEFEPQEVHALKLEKPSILSFEKENVDVEPTSIQEDETLIDVEQKEAPMETLDHIKKHVDVLEPLEVAFEKKDKPKEVEPSFQDAPGSLQLPISPPIEDTQKDVTLEVPKQIVPSTKMEEPKIEALIEEPQVPDEVTITEESQKVIEVEAPKLEEPYIPTIERDDIPIVIQDKGALVEETQEDVRVEAPMEGQALSNVEEPQIEAPITKLQFKESEAQGKEDQTFEKPYILSTDNAKVEDLKPTIAEEEEEEEEEIPIVKENKSAPIQTLEELPQHGDIKEPFEIPMEHEVEPSFEEVSKSLELPISQPIEKTHDDVGVEAPREGQDNSEVLKPQVREFEVQKKEALIFEEQHIPSTEKFEMEDVKPTSIEEEEETPIVKEEKNTPNQTLDELPQHGDVGVEAFLESQDVSDVEEPLIDIPTSEPQILHKLGAQEQETPTLEEPYVPFTKQPQDEDVKATSIKQREHTPNVKEDTNDPIQTLEELPQDSDVEAPFEDPTEKKIELEEVQPNVEEVPRSLELPISHPIKETKGDVGIETLQDHQLVSELKEPEIFHKLQEKEKEPPTLEQPHVPSTEQRQDQDVKPTSTEDEEEDPIVKEDTSTPIQTLHQLPQDNDKEAPFEVPIEKKVEPEEEEPKVPRSLELPISHAIGENQGDVSVEALLEGQDVSMVKEPQIEAPIMKPQIPQNFEAQEKEVPTLEERYVPSIEQLQDQDVKPTSIEEQEETPIVKEDTNAPIQALQQLPQDSYVDTPFEVATRKEVKPKEVEPSFEDVPRSLELPITQPVEETRGNFGVEALLEHQHVSKVGEPQIKAPIVEPQILRKLQTQDKEATTLQAPCVPSTKQPQDENIKPTSIEEEEETPIGKEYTSDPIHTLHELPQDDDVEAPFEVATKKKVEPEEAAPSFEEVQKSLDLPINNPIDETQGDVAIKTLLEGQNISEVKEPQIDAPILELKIPHKLEAQENEAPALEEPHLPTLEQPQDQDVKPTSIEEEEETPIVKGDTIAPTKTLQQLPQDSDVEAPFGVPTRKEVEPEEVEPSFEEVSRSLELPISHHVEKTQGNVGVEALQEPQHVFEVEEPQVDAPIMEPQILPKFQAQDKEAPTFEEPYVPFIEQPQDEDVKPTSIKEQQDTQNIKEDTSDPIQTLEELPQDGGVEAPSKVPIERNIEHKEVEPSFEEVPRSLQLPISHPIEETPGDVGVEAMQEGPHVSEVDESQINTPITELTILHKFEPQDKHGPKLQEPYVPSTEQPQDEDVKPTSIEEEETPIAKEHTSNTLQTLDKLPQDVHLEAPFEVPTKNKIDLEEVEPSCEDLPRSVELPITHPNEETQGDVGVEALLEGQDVSDVKELQIEAPIIKPEIPHKFDNQEIEEPYVPSIEQLQDQDLKPTSIEDKDETPIIKEHKSAPIQALHELPQVGDLEAPFEVATPKEVDSEEVEPSSKKVPRSLELPISHPVQESQCDVGIKALQPSEHVSEVEGPQIPHKFQVEEKDAPTFEELSIPSTKLPQDKDVQPPSIEGEEEAPIIQENTSDPIQAFDALPEDGDVEAPFDVPTEKKVEPEEVEPSFNKVPRSLELPITQPLEESQGDVGVQALQKGATVSEVEEPQIPCNFEVEEKEAPTLEQPHVGSIELPQDKDVQPTSIEEEEETPIVKEDTTDPIPSLDELPKDGDVEAPFDVPTEKQDEPEEVKPSFQEVPRSLELPISHPVEESQGDVGIEALHEGECVSKVHEPQLPREFETKEKHAPTLEESYFPSTELPQDKDVQPTSFEEAKKTTIVKEATSDPIKSVDELPQDRDVEAPLEVPTTNKGELEEVQRSFEEVPRSLELPISSPIEETQRDVGVEASNEGEHVSDVDEPQIDAPVTEPQIPHKFEAQEKEAFTFEKPYVPSIEQPQNQDVKPTSIEDVEKTPIIKEDTTGPIPSPHKLPKEHDVEAPLEVATREEVEPKEVEPTFEKLPKSLELPISHHVEESQGDAEVRSLQEDERVSEEEEPHIPRDIEAKEKEAPTFEEPHVNSSQLPQDKHFQPASIEEEDESPILKEDTNDPIQTLDELPQHGDVEGPHEVPTEKKLEHEEPQPSFDEVPRSFELPINHAIEETQGDVGLETLQEGELVSEIRAPNSSPVGSSRERGFDT